MKNKYRFIVTAAILAGIGAAWLHYARRGGDAPDTRLTPAPFTRADMEVTIESTAVVEPRNRLEIKPPLAGRIEEVLAHEGDIVRQGDIVARMSSTERATLLDAARTKGAAMLQKWADAYQPTPLIAPMTGAIIARKVEPGQTVSAGDTVLVMSDQLTVTAQVDETDIGRIKAGQGAVVILDAYPDEHISGAVRHIAYEAVTINNVTVYEVEVAPETIPGCMKSGMTATARFIIAVSSNALTLPLDAVMTVDGGQAVMVSADPDKPPGRRRVRTGLTAGGRVEILDGLDGRETVWRPDFVLPAAGTNGSSPLMPGPPKR